jgi:hypothetical protein
MKNTLQINACFDKPELLEKMVEELAHRRFDNGSTTIVANDWESIKTSGTETYVSGTVACSDTENESVSNAFITQFLFTCSKARNEPYKLLWSMSLN